MELQDRDERDLKPYEKNPAKNVMLPAFARPKHVKVEERTQRLTQWAETAEINRMEINDPSIGIITPATLINTPKRPWAAAPLT